MSDMIEPVVNGRLEDLTAIDEINGAVRHLLSRLHSQDALLVQQVQDIERLRAKVEQLRGHLDLFYKHCGLESRQPSAEEIRELVENGLTSEQFWAEVNRTRGN